MADLTRKILDRIYNHNGQKTRRGYLYVCRGNPQRTLILPLNRPKSVVSRQDSMELASKNQVREFQRIYRLEALLKNLIGDQEYQSIYGVIGSKPYILAELIMGFRDGKRPSVEGYGPHLADSLDRVLRIYRSYKDSLGNEGGIKFQYLSRSMNGVYPLRKLLGYNLIQEHDHYRLQVRGDLKVQAMRALQDETRNIGLYRVLL